MKISKPRISIILPAYNAADYITLAIDSILGQSAYADESEILVVDDRSSDNTKTIVNSLSHRHPQVKLIDNQRKKGPSGARNTGLQHAKGDYIAFLDADDLWYPNHLESGIRFLEANPAIDIVFYNFDIVELETNRHTGDWFSEKKFTKKLRCEKLTDQYYRIIDDMLNALIEESFLHLQSMVIRSSACQNILFNETIVRSGDRDFAISLAVKSNAKYAYGLSKTGVWHRHAKSLTSNNSGNFLAMALDHIAYFSEYLAQYSERPNTAGILKRELLENHIDASYQYRSKHELGPSFKHLLASAKYGFSPSQPREFVKIIVSALIHAFAAKSRAPK